jgi:hypothetical protein
MKSFVISAGLVAVGTASLQSVLADPSIPAPSPKIWSVSATLRGFYDSNYATSPTAKGSYGIELTPSVSLNDSFQQTDVGVRYTYGLYWYNARQVMSQNAFDQTHQVDLWLDHAFNERWKVTTSDTFVSGQQPSLLTGAGTPFRVEGNNIDNHFNTTLGTQWTRELGTSLHYENDYYDFQNSGLATLLNREDQAAGLDLQWTFDPQTMAFVGYTFEWVDYLGSGPLGTLPPIPPSTVGTTVGSDYRNYYNHQVYVGLQHQITANLSAQVKAGAQYVDNYNETIGDKESWSPYGTVSLTYTYLPGSYVQVGASQTDQSTYAAGVASNGTITQYQEVSTLYGSINHHFTQKLIGSATGQFYYAEYHGGLAYSPDADYSAGLNLTYLFNQYLSGDIGYNYDHLRSGVPGAGYEENRWYIGVTATY